MKLVGDAPSYLIGLKSVFCPKFWENLLARDAKDKFIQDEIQPMWGQIEHLQKKLWKTWKTQKTWIF